LSTKDVYDQAKQKVKVETGTVGSDIALLQYKKKKKKKKRKENL